MYKKHLYVFLFLIHYSVIACAGDNTNELRKMFGYARQSLLEKHYQQFAHVNDRLKSYPLYPYLLYIKLKQPLAYQNKSEMDDFLETYKDTPLANKLRTECLIKSARRRDWSYFIHYYRPIYGPTLQCYYLNALLATHQEHAAYQAIPELWLALNSPPAICRSVFSLWEHTGGLNQKLLWEKLEQAISEDNISIIQHLAQFLPYDKRPQLRRWYRVHRHPLLITSQREQFNAHNNMDRKIILHGMHRLATKKPFVLAENWSLLNKTYTFTETEQQTVLRELAIALARRSAVEAEPWLKQIKPFFSDTVLREWRVRHALLKGNWQQVLYWIEKLTPDEQQLSCWRYWRARALAETQHTEHAIDMYKQLAKEVDYYGVLASQRLKQDYHPVRVRIMGDGVALRQNKAIQRARELYILGFIGDARREWQWALDSLSSSQLQAAAQLAKQWKWYDLAIIGATKAHMYNDIKLRFPFAYRSSVLSAAKQSSLNSAWIWAIMRQESAFMPGARSSAGALGLMQIMPETGKGLARSLNLRTANLLDPNINVRLGSFYLHYLLKLFDGNAILATAAYNAGPTRIKNYQSLYRRLPKDVWVEMLPWKETRDYVKSVNLARNIYNQI